MLQLAHASQSWQDVCTLWCVVLCAPVPRQASGSVTIGSAAGTFVESWQPPTAALYVAAGLCVPALTQSTTGSLTSPAWKSSANGQDGARWVTNTHCTSQHTSCQSILSCWRPAAVPINVYMMFRKVHGWLCGSHFLYSSTPCGGQRWRRPIPLEATCCVKWCSCCGRCSPCCRVEYQKALETAHHTETSRPYRAVAAQHEETLWCIATGGLSVV